MKKTLLIIGNLVVICGLVAAAVVVLRLRHQPVPIVPVAIQQQVSFVIYVPGSDWQTPTQDMSYQSSVLQMRSSQTNTQLTITQQATPSVFSDVPQYFPTLITRLNEYSSFGSIYGTVHLTKPKELNGQQQAVLNTSGTLMFVHPSHNLSDDTWRRFFNGLQVVKPD